MAATAIMHRGERNDIALPRPGGRPQEGKGVQIPDVGPPDRSLPTGQIRRLRDAGS